MRVTRQVKRQARQGIAAVFVSAAVIFAGGFGIGVSVGTSSASEQSKSIVTGGRLLFDLDGCSYRVQKRLFGGYKLEREPHSDLPLCAEQTTPKKEADSKFVPYNPCEQAIEELCQPDYLSIAFIRNDY